MPDADYSLTDFVVLVAEDEPRPQADLLEHLARIPSVKTIPVASKDDAIAACDENYVDAAVVDIELGTPGAGLDLLDYLGDRGRHVPVVVATKLLGGQYGRTLAPLTSLERPRIIKVLDKNREGADRVVPIFTTLVDEWTSSRPSLIGLDLAVDLLLERKSRFKGIGLRSDRKSVEREVDRALHQLFGGTAGLAADRRPSVSLRRLEREGLSGAVTVEGEILLGEAADGQQVAGNRCVIKLGPINDIKQEVERYDEFVKFGVRLSQRVELLGFSLQDAIGAVCYSFAGGVFGERLVTLDELLDADDEYATVKMALKRLFGRANRNWYGVDCGRMAPQQYMTEAYETDFDNVYRFLHAALEKPARNFRTRGFGFTPATADHDGTFDVGTCSLIIPRRDFAGVNELWLSRPACLVHGDMHGGNVMLELSPRTGQSSVKRVCLIDYHNAGPGPRAVDVIAVEASLRLADAARIVAEHSDQKRGALSNDALATALDVAANRVALEEAVLDETWRRRRGGKPSTYEGWMDFAKLLGALLRENFRDMEKEEYVAVAVPCAMRQCGYDISKVARVRMLAWASALYASLGVA